MSTLKSPTAFLSYSWEDEAHKKWAHDLAVRLRSDGIDASIDQWSAVPGDQLPQFMEQAIGGNQYVLIVCTPHYKTRSEQRRGGVGYEGDIMTAEIYQSRNHRKFIPILRRGEWSDAAPSWLSGKYYVDLRNGPHYEPQYEDLLSTLLGARSKAPPLGPLKQVSNASSPSAKTPVPTEDVPRILGVIADEVGEPRNDGTRGSALYEVPFRLSCRVSDRWADTFEHVWNRPPQFTSMHRPGIASVSGDRITLNGTTVEEVQKYHRDTLVLCVRETNRIVQEHEEAVRRVQAEQARRRDEHRTNVRDVADKIRFDD